MNCFKKLVSVILMIALLLTFLPVVRADDTIPADDGQIPSFEPGPILNEMKDHSIDLVIDSDTEITSDGLLNSVLKRKLEEDIDTLLNFQPIDSESVGNLLYSIDSYLQCGGFDYTCQDVGSVLLKSDNLGRHAAEIGLQDTGKELIEVLKASDNSTGYIFVIDRDSVGIRVEDRKGEGIANALVTISYKDQNGATVTRAQYTTDGELPGLCGFDKMNNVSYITIDVQAADYRAQTILDKRVDPGDILYFQLQDSPADDVYLRCVDMGGKNMLTEDTALYLVESGSRPLDMRVIVTAKGGKSLPETISLKDYHTERNIINFTDYSKIETGGVTSRMFTRSEDWMKKGGLLQQDDILFFDLEDNKQVLELVSVNNALMQPGASNEQLPLTGVDKKIPLTDVMGGSGIASLTVNYLKIPVTVGVFPEGGFILVATFDIESLSEKYSSLFEESWNPKTRGESESIFEPFKQEFWRKADRFKNESGQLDKSKSVSLTRDKYWNFSASFSLFCSGVYNKDTKDFEGSFGCIFDAKLTGGITQYFLVTTPIVIPFYLGFDVYGEFKSTITANFLWNRLSDGLSAAFSAADHTMVQRYNLLAGLDLYAGIGLKGACSLEVGGGAMIDFAAIEGTVEEDHKDAIRFLIDSFASIRVSGAIAFFSFNLFNKSFGPWRLYDSHPDRMRASAVEENEEEVKFLDMDLSAVSEKGTLLLAGTDEQPNHYKMDSLGAEVLTVNDTQTITTLSSDTFSDSQVQIVSTGKTTALFRIASIDGKARVIYQKQDPETGEFMDDYYELPALMGYDVTEFDVAASTADDNRFDNLFYVGCVVADRNKSDIKNRSMSTRVQGLILDLNTDSVRRSDVKSPLLDVGKYFYFNPRVAGNGSNIAVAYQKAPAYLALDQAKACVFGTNEKEVVMGQGSIFTSGDIVPGEPSFFLTNRSLTTREMVVIDGYMADGSFDEKNPRSRYFADVSDYQLQENENYLSNWGYANNTNYAIIAGKLYFLEKYANDYDAYGYGMRLTQVEKSEGLINRDNIYEFVVNDDKSAICLVSATTNYQVNMETGESTLNGSTLKIYTLEGQYDSASQSSRGILHGPLDVFVKDIEINTFAAVFNRKNCESKGLSVVYANAPKESLRSDSTIVLSSDIYQWQQNLKRGMVVMDVEFADLFHYADEFALPVFVTFRNIGYAIEEPVAFTVKDENNYDMHELLYNEQTGEWYDLGNEVVHNAGKLYSGDIVTIELLVATPYFWESNKVHEVNVEISPKFRGDAQSSFKTPVYNNSLTLQGEQIALGKKHYADLSITNIADKSMSLNRLEIETLYRDKDRSSHVAHLDLSELEADPDLDKYALRYDLTPIWEKAERDGILAVRFCLVDENGKELTGESVFMLPKQIATMEEDPDDSEVLVPTDTETPDTGDEADPLFWVIVMLLSLSCIICAVIKKKMSKR